MDDLISRQAAIDVLDEQIEQCNKSLSSFDISMRDEYAVKVERASLVAFREILEYLPPAQLGTNLAEVGTDCISRQAAIDVVSGIDSEFVKYIEQLPSAQPEIIRCNSCKYWTQSTGKMKGYGLGRCDFHDADLVACNGFCYWAERRTDE